MAETKNMSFARNLKIVVSHDIKSESTGTVAKVDGNWRYIKWDNGVKTWHRVEQLQEQARRKVAVKQSADKVKRLAASQGIPLTDDEALQVAEDRPAAKKPSPRKPHPAVRKPKAVDNVYDEAELQRVNREGMGN